MSELELDFDSGDECRQNYAECPEPGIHHDVPFEQYASWKAINSGVVKWGTISPKHMQAAFAGDLKAEDSRSMKLGRAIHCMLLEPESFDERFTIARGCEATLKSGDRKGVACGKTSSAIGSDGRWFCGTHKPDSPLPLPADCITEDERNRAASVIEQLKSHFAVKLFRRKGWSEVSVVWEYAGFPMKCRLDRYAPNPPTIIDVKKCQVGRGDIDSCGLSIRRYGWDMQAALYVEAVERQTGQRPKFIWVFVEDKAPFDVQVIIASKETLAVGWHKARSAIQRYARAVAAGDVTGYLAIPENVKTGGLPLRDIQEAMNAGWFNEGNDDDSSSDETGDAGDVRSGGDGFDGGSHGGVEAGAVAVEA